MVRSAAATAAVAVLALASATLAGCGEDTYMPDDVVYAIEATDEAFEAGDPDAACDALGYTMTELGRWSETAINQLQVLINETMNDVSGTRMYCGLDTGGPVDLERMRSSWERARDRLREGAKMESGWGRVFLWVGAFVSFGLIGVFLRRWMFA